MNYTTTFPDTENPISQGSKWTNGDAVGLDWCNVRTTGGTPGLAYGTQDGNGNYDDSIAILSGAVAADQMGYGTVYKNSPGGTECKVEILLRGNINANSATLYECQFSLASDKRLQIVEWLGPYGAEHTGWEIRATLTGANVINDGDVVKGIIIGNLVVSFVNDVEVLRYASANNIASGHPGIGMYQAGATNANFGFKGITLTDALRLYAGACDAVGVADGSGTNTDYVIVFWKSYTVPGSGAKTIKELMSDVHQNDQSYSCDLRLAVYNASRTVRLGQTARFTPTYNGGADAWQGDAVCSGFASVNGGDTVVLAWAAGPVTGGGARVASEHTDSSRSAGSYKEFLTYCVDGFPADMSGITADGTDAMFPMRFAVEDTVTGPPPTPPTLINIATPRWRK